jgi:tetratricopeptide (TPR) repeat protein
MIGSARRRFATALLLALLLGQQIALAQVDQVARGWAFQLYTVYQQGQQTGNWGPFLQSCAMDPVMTKKIFVTVLQYSGEVSADPVAVRDTLQFARDLARFINDNLGDPQPAAIMRAVDAARPNEELAEMVLQYALGLYPELRQSSGSVVANQFHPASQKYGEKEVLPTLMEQRDLAVYRPLYKNFLAIQLTITFACLDQGIEQVDRGTRLIQEAKGTIAARPQAAPWAFQVLDFFQSGLDIYRLSVASELGLLQQAEQQLPMVMDKPENRNWRSGLLLSCARTALAQGNASAAGDYLRRCRGKLDTFVPPPLEYAIRTAEYQTRRLSGYRPDGREKLRDFKQAWQAFSGYRPFQLVHADGFWYYGRKATRFWLAELEPGSAESIEAGQFLMGELGTWSAGMTNPGPWAMSQDEQVFNCEQAGNFLNATMALIEQSLTIFEARASVQAPEASVGELASTLQLVESFPKLLGLNQSDAAERLDLTRAGLYCQLLGRIRLLQARVPTLPAAERLALIEQGVELVGRSREPDIIMDSLLSSGRLARELGRAELAVANWEKALALAESIGYVQQAAEASSLLADQHSKAGDWKQAAFYADKAAQKLQAGVALAAGDTRSARKLARTTDQVTEVSVKAAAQANQPEKALAALVRGKEAQSATAQMQGQGQAQVQVAAVARK